MFQFRLKSVLWIPIRIRRIVLFLGLQDPDPDPSLFCTDPNPDPSINKQKSKKKTRFPLFFVFFSTFYLFLVSGSVTSGTACQVRSKTVRTSKSSRPATGDIWVPARPKQQKSQPAMKCSERDETERDIPLMDLLDGWESPHKIQDSRKLMGVPSKVISKKLWIKKLFFVGILSVR